MNSKSGSILIIDDNQDILIASKMLLKKTYPLVVTESDPNRIPILLARQTFDVILLDMNFSLDASSGQEGFYWLDKILSLDTNAVVILMTAYGDVNTAVKAVKAGATDFVLKPWQNQKLFTTITSAMALKESRQEVCVLTETKRQLSAELNKQQQDFIGESEVMQQVFNVIERAAKTDANILILGESGTGKEVVAREIHRQSLRAQEVFISVDVGSLSDNLFESELFGHRKGAFTGAQEERSGRFELANNGSLFLDELGNVPLALQAKLLTAIQQKRVTKVGGNQSTEVNIRLICATNENLIKRVAEQSFRQDLLYRINTVEIHLPPLRERKTDIPLLVDYYLQKFTQRYKRPSLEVTKLTYNALMDYHWPGNIRELAHCIERAVILSPGKELDLTSMGLSSSIDIELISADDKGDSNQSEPMAVNHELPTLNIAQLEITAMRAALKQQQGNVSQAAKLLGITRMSLYRRMEKHGL